MSDIIKFNVGCRNCKHLQPIGNGNYTCSELNYEDGSSIYPIRNGKRTDDWGACGGEDRVSTKSRRGNSVI